MAEARTYVDSGNLSRKVIAIAAGEAHTLALTADGDVYSWGRGTFGRLGNGSEVDQFFPVKIEFSLTDKRDKVKIVGISAGAYHSLALADDGSVWSWGYNAYGQLGFDGENSIVPCLVKMPMTDGSATENEKELKISSVKAGGMMSLAIDNLGTLWMWGSCPEQQTPTPISINFPGHTVVKVACGSEHIVALAKNEDGILVCYTWGNNNHGQLGLGHTETSPNPQIVEKFCPDSPLAPYEIACGAFHTCVLTYKKTESVTQKSVCWTFGLGDNGQLGQGTTKRSMYPEMVIGLPENSRFVSVACGLFHTSLVSSSGEIWSWGMENGLGLCPEATFTESDGGDALTPRLINGPNFPDPVQVACGAAHTVLVAESGYKIWSWGRGKNGILGNGHENDHFTPRVVSWPPQGPRDEEETVVKDDGVERLGAVMEEMERVKSRGLVMERYAGFLYGLLFGKVFEGDKDIPISFKELGSFDVGKEWEDMLESCDKGKLVRLKMFYRNMLEGVEDKIMKDKVKEMIKEYIGSSGSSGR
ncbi:ultraviolet-B receptor UVR8 [Lactuca sativa]|uniref:RCC1-like domain-containing protein n=1 Tax=Lactuca sativa TaxID=4236 RepID=A0A9R1VG69_LACSA|nr:ultraviolet-B receptor UVR8 [Lactuca sativa]KAJ0204719.1 hypothetical protein LSAT_V11C500240440 [Lactuca sativa]